MSLRDMTDDDLDQLRRDVLTEQERRRNLATVPGTVAALSREYLDGGGDPQQLQDAITP